MGRPVKEGLRSFNKPEEQELQRVVKATSERVDSVRRAKALLSVAAGKSRTTASQEVGLSREGVSKVVRGFNQRGLDVLEIAVGRGPRRPTRARNRRASWPKCSGHRIEMRIRRPPGR